MNWQMALYLLVTAGLLHTFHMSVVLAQLVCRGGQNCSELLCPYTSVQYTCNISVPHTFTRWTVPAQSCGGTSTTLLLLRQSAQSNCGSQSIQCGLFQASNISPVGDTPCTSSILYVSITPELNGSSITCNSSNVSAQYYIGSVTVLVLSTPGLPHLSVSAQLNGLKVHCSPGDQAVICNVTIEINGAVRSIASNGTLDGLASNTLYQVSARAINRCRDYSEINASHWTLPEAPSTSSIRVLQSSINESAIQLTISWSHVVSPGIIYLSGWEVIAIQFAAQGGNVLQYKIRSISGMNILMFEVAVQGNCIALNCMYSQIVQKTESYYKVTISSVNDGGVGPESDPVKGQSESSFNASISVGVGVGVGLLIVSMCALLAFAYIAKKRRGSHSPMAAENQESKSNLQCKSDDPRKDNVTGLFNHEFVDHNQSSETVTSLRETDNEHTQSTDDAKLGLLQKTSEVIVQTSFTENDPIQHEELVMQETGKPLLKRRPLQKRTLYYIKNPQDGTVLTTQGSELIFSAANYVPDDTQLWICDGQPDGSFIIVSKMATMVLTCTTEEEIKMQERLGNESQKWWLDNNRVSSSKYAICAREGKPSLACITQKTICENDFCFLQPSPKVPYFMLNDKDGSVLEMKNDTVIHDAAMDPTCCNQHWYMYILPTKKEGVQMHIIVSRNGEKALKWNGAGLTADLCDCEDEDQQWTLNPDSFIVPQNKEKSWPMKIKVYTVFRSYFLIKYLCSYQTYDHKENKVILSHIEDKSMVPERHLWQLDVQPDGTFKIVSGLNRNMLIWSNNTFTTSKTSKFDECKFWRREGNFIKSSDNNSGYIGIDFPNDMQLSMHCKSNDDNNWRQTHECTLTKVLINVSQIIHKATNRYLTYKKSDTEEIKEGSMVVLSPNNGSSSHNQNWILDYRLDGTFLIVAKSKTNLVVTCEHDTASMADTKLIMSRFNGKDNQLWRFDGSYIESLSFQGHVVSSTSTSGPDSDLILCVKDATSKEQVFKHQSMIPVYIKNIQSGLVLELTAEGTDVKCNPPSDKISENQQWHIEYVKGLGGKTFMIISKKNGKALQTSGTEVKVAAWNNQNVEQHWRKEGCHLLSQEQIHDHFIKVVSASKEGNRLSIEIESSKLTYKPEQCFEIQYVAAESYF